MGYLRILLEGLWRIRYYILVSTIAFAVGIVVGVIVWEDMAQQVMNEFGNINEILSMGALEVYLYILQHNLFIAFPLSYGLGITVVAPIIIMLVNGAGVSALVVYFEATMGIPAVFSIAAMLPHGVLEVPAVILAASTGIDFGVSTWLKVFKRISMEEYKKRLKQQVTILLLVFILLVTAAAIETGLIMMASSFYNV